MTSTSLRSSFEDNRPQNQLSTVQHQHKHICTILQGASVTLHTILWKWVAPFTLITHLSLLRTWFMIHKELRNLLPSFICVLSTTLPNSSIPDAHFPVLLSSLIRSWFHIKPATLLFPVDLFFFLCGRPKVPKWLLFLIRCGEFFYRLRSFYSKRPILDLFGPKLATPIFAGGTTKISYTGTSSP